MQGGALLLQAKPTLVRGSTFDETKEDEIVVGVEVLEVGFD